MSITKVAEVPLVFRGFAQRTILLILHQTFPPLLEFCALTPTNLLI